MKSMIKLGVLASFGLLALVSTARAEETKIPIGELPKAVLDAVKTKFPSAQLVQAEKETEDGKTIYEVGLTHKGTKLEVAVSDKGKIVEIEKAIAVKELPRSVLAKIEAAHSGATIKKAEEVVVFKDGKEETRYEVVVTKDKKSVELSLSSDGKILEEETDKGDKDKD